MYNAVIGSGSIQTVEDDRQERAVVRTCVPVDESSLQSRSHPRFDQDALLLHRTHAPYFATDCSQEIGEVEQHTPLLQRCVLGFGHCMLDHTRIGKRVSTQETSGDVCCCVTVSLGLCHASSQGVLIHLP